MKNRTTHFHNHIGDDRTLCGIAEEELNGGCGDEDMGTWAKGKTCTCEDCNAIVAHCLKIAANRRKAV